MLTVRRNKLPRSKLSLMPLPPRKLRRPSQSCLQLRLLKLRKKRRWLMLLPSPRKKDLIINHQRKRRRSRHQRLRLLLLHQPHQISHQSLPEPLPNTEAEPKNPMMTHLTPLTAMMNEPIFIKLINTLLLFDPSLTMRPSLILNI